MTDEPWTIGRLLVWTVDYLKKHGAENPRLDAEVLLASARGCQRIDLYAAYGEEAGDELRAKFRDYVGRRAKGEPVAYIVGHKEFYALDFEVTRDVLIPRPETEMLVVALLDQAKRQGTGKASPSRQEAESSTEEIAPSAQDSADPVLGTPYSVSEAVVRGSPDPTLPTTEGLPPSAASAPSSLHIADIGTGSGILAVCAAKHLPNASVTAVDISPAALAVARRNAERHSVAEQITFVESDLFAAVVAGKKFDIIVSNPPYVSTAEMVELAPSVRDFEPRLALEAGAQGTEVVARLITEGASRLNSGGALLMEISPMIAAEVERLIGANNAFEPGRTLRDPAGHPRIVQALRR